MKSIYTALCNVVGTGSMLPFTFQLIGISRNRNWIKFSIQLFSHTSHTAQVVRSHMGPVANEPAGRTRSISMVQGALGDSAAPYHVFLEGGSEARGLCILTVDRYCQTPL